MAYGETDWTNNTEYLNFPGLRYYHLTHTDSSGGDSAYVIHCDYVDGSTFTYEEDFSDILYAYTHGSALRMSVSLESNLCASLVSDSYSVFNEDDDNVTFIFSFCNPPFLIPNANFAYFCIASNESSGVILNTYIPSIVPSDGIDFLDSSYLRVKEDSSVLNFLPNGDLSIKYDGSVMSVNNNGLSLKLQLNGGISVNNGLYVRIDNDTIKNDNGILYSDVKTDCLEEISYLDLYSKWENGDLIPGKQYKIIDYTAIVKKSERYTSALNYFYIIVTADSKTQLNENARATIDSDSASYLYFKYCNLDAWEIKYSLINDSSRFEWANDTRDGENMPVGRGVIYYMKDEYGNEAPYDFKNILFLMSKVNRINEDDVQIDTNQSHQQIYTNAVNEFVYSVKTDGYDYLRSLFKFNNDTFFTYTFSTPEYNDDTVEPEVKCKMNVIKPTIYNYYDSNVPHEQIMTLPSNVFICSSTSGCYNNFVGDNCFSNIFHDGCEYNVLKNNSYGNALGKFCSYNELNYSWCNALLGYSTCNKIIQSYLNIFSHKFNFNTVNLNCSNLIINDTFYSNTIDICTRFVAFGFKSGKSISQYNFNSADGSSYYSNNSSTYLECDCSIGGAVNTSRATVVFYENDPNVNYFYAMNFADDGLHPIKLSDC